MSDDTPVQDGAPAAAPVDQAPAQASPPPDPAFVAAIAQAVAAAMAPPPSPAPLSPASVPTPAAAAPADEQPAEPAYKPGSLAVHTYDHFGRTAHQVLLVVGTYQAPITDRAGQITGHQARLRLLPVGVAHETADLPADAEQLVPADEFDWEDAA